MIAIIDGDVLVYIALWNSEDKEQARTKFDELFTAIMESVFATDYAMALGGPSNFRVDMYPEYKMNRSKAKDNRPDWFLEFKEDIERDYEGCIFTDGCEADDMVRIWALECDAKEKSRIVVSVDKDLDCIAGNHYNPRKEEIYIVDAKDANRHYWKQILMGDMTDNIPGIKGIGPKKAEAILDKADNYETAVCQAYYDAYGEDGYEQLIFNGRLIHIWRHLNDHFKIERERYDNAISK